MRELKPKQIVTTVGSVQKAKEQVCMYIFIYVCVCTCTSIDRSIDQSIYRSILISLSIHIHIHIYIYIVYSGAFSLLRIHEVPYSEHSSFPELQACVRELKPKQIVTTVGSVQKAREQVFVYLSLYIYI